MIYQISPITNPAITGIAPYTQKDTPAVFAKFFASIVGILLIAASLWAFLQLLLGGLSWISSGGDKTALESAQKRITNALVGLLLLFGSWAVYLVILQYLGIISGGPNIELKLPTLF